MIAGLVGADGGLFSLVRLTPLRMIINRRPFEGSVNDMPNRLMGHDTVLKRLSSAWKAARLAHAYLFTGPAGVGKKVAARQLAQTILCEVPDRDQILPCHQCASCRVFLAGNHPDFLEVRRPDDLHEFPVGIVRDLCVQLSLKPMMGHHRVAMVEDADSFTDNAANAFLKTLEEPPPGSLLILLADQEESQLPTIISRCQVIRFSPLAENDVAQILLTAGYTQDPETARHWASASGGSVAMAVELGDPEMEPIRRRLCEELTQTKPATEVLAREVVAFCEDAGKESSAKRQRAKLLISRVLDLFHSSMRMKATGERPHHADAGWICSLAERQSMDQLLDLIERCLQAEFHVSRNLHLGLSLECWLDDLGQIMDGRYVPTVGSIT
jgi:DNA polymerase-3 subunit delta'